MSTQALNASNPFVPNQRVVLFNQAKNITPPNTTGGFANKFTIQFPFQQTFVNAKIALASLYIYNSWFNVTSAYGNNTFYYYMPISAGTYSAAKPVVMPDGIYGINDINAWLHSTMVTNGDVLVNGGSGSDSGTPYYNLSIAEDGPRYRFQITSIPVTGLDLDGDTLSNPNNIYIAGAMCPVLEIPATFYPAGTITPNQTSFSNLTGFLPGIYPPNFTTTATTISPTHPLTAQYKINSPFIPTLTLVNSVNVTCDLVNESLLSYHGAIIYTFSPNVGAGEQIQVQPPQFLWCPVSDKLTQTISISLYDDNFNPLLVQEPGFSATVIIQS